MSSSRNRYSHKFELEVIRHVQELGRCLEETVPEYAFCLDLAGVE